MQENDTFRDTYFYHLLFTCKYNDKNPELRVISEIVYFGYSEEIRRRDWSETEGIEVSDNTVNLKRSRNMSLGR